MCMGSSYIQQSALFTTCSTLPPLTTHCPWHPIIVPCAAVSVSRTAIPPNHIAARLRDRFAALPPDASVQ